MKIKGETMQAFHNDKKIKQKYINRVKNHIKMDNLIRGKGWTIEGKGCAVGCTLETYDHSRYPIELGIPTWLAYLEDRLFENMSFEKSKTWPLVFLQAIKPGANLEQVKTPFMISVLQSTLDLFDREKFPEVEQCINSMIDLYVIGAVDEDFQDARQECYKVRNEIYSKYGFSPIYYVAVAVTETAAADTAADTAAVSDVAAVADAAYGTSEYKLTKQKTVDKFADDLLLLLKDCK
jgi:hypothetical protein